MRKKYEVIEKFNGVLEEDIYPAKKADSLYFVSSSTSVEISSAMKLQEEISKREYHTPVTWLYAENCEKFGIRLKEGMKRKNTILAMNGEYVSFMYHTNKLKIGMLKMKHWVPN